MEITSTELPGILIFQPAAHRDDRGFFMELWNQRQYQDAGLDVAFVQDNVSFSKRGTLRGLHFQNPGAQGKLVFVLQGSVFDAAVDVRHGSPTFGQHVVADLSSENRRQIYVPPGFAHGYCVTSETALVAYKCTEFYDPAAEGLIRWNDPDLGIPWPMGDPLLSARDRAAPRLRDVPAGRFDLGQDAEQPRTAGVARK